MSGKGELVEYTREFRKAPLSDDDRRELKAKIIAIIDQATTDITIAVMVKASKAKLQEELRKLDEY